MRTKNTSKVVRNPSSMRMRSLPMYY
jgi:hypothetical protein